MSMRLASSHLLLAAGLGDRLHVVGESWEGVVPGECILARFVDWQTLPALYRRAKIVLNDHQLTMRSSGFKVNDGVTCTRSLPRKRVAADMVRNDSSEIAATMSKAMTSCAS